MCFVFCNAAQCQAVTFLASPLHGTFLCGITWHTMEKTSEPVALNHSNQGNLIDAHCPLAAYQPITLHSPLPNTLVSRLTDDLATAGGTANVFSHNWGNLTRQHRKCTEFLAIAQASVMVSVYYIV